MRCGSDCLQRMPGGETRTHVKIVSMVLSVHKNQKAYWGGREGRCMDVGEERGKLYTYQYTVTNRMTPALRWAVTQDSVHRSQLLKRKKS